MCTPSPSFRASISQLLLLLDESVKYSDCSPYGTEVVCYPISEFRLPWEGVLRASVLWFRSLQFTMARHTLLMSKAEVLHDIEEEPINHEEQEHNSLLNSIPFRCIFHLQDASWLDSMDLHFEFLSSMSDIPSTILRPLHQFTAYVGKPLVRLSVFAVPLSHSDLLLSSLKAFSIPSSELEDTLLKGSDPMSSFISSLSSETSKNQFQLEYCIHLSFHHAVFDGYSSNIFFREWNMQFDIFLQKVLELRTGASTDNNSHDREKKTAIMQLCLNDVADVGRQYRSNLLSTTSHQSAFAIPSTSPSYSYQQFSDEEYRILNDSQQCHRRSVYWEEYLSNLFQKFNQETDSNGKHNLALESIPFDFPVPLIRMKFSFRTSIEVTQNIIQSISMLAKGCNVNNFIVISVLSALYFAIFHGRKRTLISCPFANRDAEWKKSVVGYMANVLPIVIETCFLKENANYIKGANSPVDDKKFSIVDLCYNFKTVFDNHRRWGDFPVSAALLAEEENSKKASFQLASLLGGFLVNYAIADWTTYDYFSRTYLSQTSSAFLELRVECMPALVGTNCPVSQCKSQKWEFIASSDVYSKETIACESQRFTAFLKMLFAFEENKSPLTQIERLKRMSAKTISAHLMDNLYQLADTHPSHVLSTALYLSVPDDAINEHSIHTIPSQHYRVLTEYRNQGVSSSRIACTLDDRSMSYEEFHSHVMHLASILIYQYGVRPGQRIAQCVERSLEMLVGIMAIMWCGGVYVPLNPQDPIPRIYYVVADAGISAILVHSSLQKLMHIGCPLVVLDGEMNATPNIENDVQTLNNGSNSAYIVYTSGSTGSPKGAQIMHANFTNICYALADRLIVVSGDRFIASASCSFDAHVNEMLTWTVLGGSTVLIRPDGNKDLQYYCSVLSQSQATAAFWVNSYANALSEFILEEYPAASFPFLRSISFGGEKVLSIMVWKLQTAFRSPSLCLFAAYGPAECTYFTTTYTVQEVISLHNFNSTQLFPSGSRPPLQLQLDDIPIGKPLRGYYCFAVDGHSLSILGLEGELYVGGRGVFAGYIHKPNMTSIALLTLPLHSEILYRTGDLVRFNSNLDLVFVGRVDFQVKLNGQRLEVGEIESCILSCPDTLTYVRECVVLKCVRDGNEFLVAFCRRISTTSYPEDEDLDYVALDTSNRESLHTHVSSHLQSYMVPKYYIFLDTFPLNTNGKLDRKALNEIVMSMDPSKLQQTSAISTSDSSSTSIISPRNELESLLFTFFVESLLIPPNRQKEFSITTSFFAAGGGSLAAMRLVAKINAGLAARPLQEGFNGGEKLTDRATPAIVKLSIASLFKYPTVQLLASICVVNRANPPESTHSERSTLTEESSELPLYNESLAALRSKELSASGPNAIRSTILLHRIIDSYRKQMVSLSPTLKRYCEFDALDMKKFESNKSKSNMKMVQIEPCCGSQSALLTDQLIRLNEGNISKFYQSQIIGEYSIMTDIVFSSHGVESMLKQKCGSEYPDIGKEREYVHSRPQAPTHKPVQFHSFSCFPASVNLGFVYLSFVELIIRHESLRASICVLQSDLDAELTVSDQTRGLEDNANWNSRSISDHQTFVQILNDPLDALGEDGFTIQFAEVTSIWNLGNFFESKWRAHPPLNLTPSIKVTFVPCISVGETDAQLQKDIVQKQVNSIQNVFAEFLRRFRLFVTNCSRFDENLYQDVVLKMITCNLLPELENMTWPVIDDQLCLILFSGHHAFIDGLSRVVLAREFIQNYEKWCKIRDKYFMSQSSLEDGSLLSWVSSCSISYMDYCMYEREVLAVSAVWPRALEFWRNHLVGVDEVVLQTSIPTDIGELTPASIRSFYDEITGDPQMSFVLHPDTYSCITHIGSVMNMTETQIWSALVAFFLNIVSGSEMKIVCTGFMSGNRWFPELEGLVGNTVSLVPLTIRFNEIDAVSSSRSKNKAVGDVESLYTYFLRCRDIMVELFQFNFIPYPTIVSELHPKILPTAPFHPYFKVCINHVDYLQDLNHVSSLIKMSPSIETEGIFVILEHIRTHGKSISARSDRSIGLLDFAIKNIWMDGGYRSVILTVHGDENVYPAGVAAFLLRRFVTMLSRIQSLLQTSDMEHLNLRDVGMISTEEISLLNSMSYSCIKDRYTKDVASTTIPSQHYRVLTEYRNQGVSSSRIACTLDDRSMSYEEFHSHVMHLASILIYQYGVRPGQRIAQCVERSLEMLVGIMAIMWCGGVYVPFTPVDPVHRILFLVRDVEAQVVLTAGTSDLLSASLYNIGASQINITLGAQFYSATLDFRNFEVSSLDKGSLAYIIYTSGSTGQPKGAQIYHSSFIELVKSSLDAKAVSVHSSFLCNASCTFDAHMWELVSPLLVGGSAVLVKPNGQMDLHYYVNMIFSTKVNTTFWVPSFIDAIAVFCDETLQWKKLESLSTITSGGEGIKAALVAKIRRNVLLSSLFLHGYGPTECTFATTWIIVTQECKDPIPIGRPLRNWFCYVVKGFDCEWALQYLGFRGELLIGGVGLFAGYNNRGDLTDKSLQILQELHNEPLYLSGDLCYFNEEMDLIFDGRVDFQVKLNGQRLEVGEIESCILSCPDTLTYVRECVVLKCVRDGNEFLVAFCRRISTTSYPEDEDLDYVALDTSNRESLHTHVSSHLQSYMVPKYYIFLDTFPLNTNGKLDRKALNEIVMSMDPSQLQQTYLSDEFSSLLLDNTSIPSPLEEILSACFVEILGLSFNDSSFPVTRSFFSLGGSSLMAIRLATRLNQLQQRGRLSSSRRVSAAEVFKYPSVRQLADYLEGNENDIHLRRNTTKQNFHKTGKQGWNISDEAPNRSFPERILAEVGNSPYEVGRVENIANSMNSVHPIVGSLRPDMPAVDERNNATNSATSSPRNFSTDIAIVGMSCHVAKCNSVEQYWQFLLQGGEGVTTLSEEHLLKANVPPAQIQDPCYRPFHCSLAPDIEDDISRSSSLYELHHPEIPHGNSLPLRVLLDDAYSALLEAGYSKWKQSNSQPCIGLFAAAPEDHLGILSHVLDLTGPCIRLSTACASSLAAVSLACDQLVLKRCDMALAGATYIEPNPVGYSVRGIPYNSADGHTRSFDKDAAGAVNGSASGIVVLRRLADAIAAGNPIHAVIRGTAITNAGASRMDASSGLPVAHFASLQKAIAISFQGTPTPTATVPSSDLMELVSSIGYYEGHGIGGKVADSMELNGIQELFQDVIDCKDPNQLVAVGAAMANIGHSAATGMASLIKAALAVKFNEIPPQINFSHLNSVFSSASVAPFYVHTAKYGRSCLKWISQTKKRIPRRALVASVGGNGHVAALLLEQFRP